MEMSGAAGFFLYFAFGSNLLKERLQLANPSAKFYQTGRLKDYKLNFGLWKEHIDNNAWHGGVATIESYPGAEVWGVIWTLNNEHLSSLDDQEGVKAGIYSPLEVSVETDNGTVLCRTYQMNNFHACPPSPQYKQARSRTDSLWSTRRAWRRFKPTTTAAPRSWTESRWS
ncbi:gamma-glutamylcyclotransferase a isoform X2 [Oreochromis niloticus]|uniref:gamma-glutamylcyclotransferase a isoform X2 n=1 Tax=Oreochromis niloticus TaxID=8128 RepID=UPI000DF16FA1|nr:gamma-glutamylcyclotransferase isoform X2 [Oreochromis niloticus]